LVGVGFLDFAGAIQGLERCIQGFVGGIQAFADPILEFSSHILKFMFFTKFLYEKEWKITKDIENFL